MVFQWTFLMDLFRVFTSPLLISFSRSKRKWTRKLHYQSDATWYTFHDYPRDEGRVFMPPLPGIAFIFIFLSAFLLVLGKYAFYFVPGLLNGYLLYSFIHWAIHKFQPPKYFAALWRHHNMHHYRYPDKAFGVSSCIKKSWDSSVSWHKL